MDQPRVVPTGHERTFGEDEIIVSKTDPQGRLTYMNHVFLSISGYEEHEILGRPHSVIRHPDMPRCVFKLLWDRIQSGREIFAYVVNMSKNGDHYWVFAHVTPTFDHQHRIIGYHSNRRVPEPRPLALVKDLYTRLLAIEREHPDRRKGLVASTRKLEDTLSGAGLEYEEFVLSM